jgi:hypothetical protein
MANEPQNLLSIYEVDATLKNLLKTLGNNGIPKKIWVEFFKSPDRDEYVTLTNTVEAIQIRDDWVSAARDGETLRFNLRSKIPGADKISILYFKSNGSLGVIYEGDDAEIEIRGEPLVEEESPVPKPPAPVEGTKSLASDDEETDISGEPLVEEESPAPKAPVQVKRITPPAMSEPDSDEIIAIPKISEGSATRNLLEKLSKTKGERKVIVTWKEGDEKTRVKFEYDGETFEGTGELYEGVEFSGFSFTFSGKIRNAGKINHVEFFLPKPGEEFGEMFLDCKDCEGQSIYGKLEIRNPPENVIAGPAPPAAAVKEIKAPERTPLELTDLVIVDLLNDDFNFKALWKRVVETKENAHEIGVAYTKKNGRDGTVELTNKGMVIEREAHSKVENIRPFSFVFSGNERKIIDGAAQVSFKGDANMFLEDGALSVIDGSGDEIRVFGGKITWGARSGEKTVTAPSPVAAVTSSSGTIAPVADGIYNIGGALFSITASVKATYIPIFVIPQYTSKGKLKMYGDKGAMLFKTHRDKLPSFLVAHAEKVEPERGNPLTESEKESLVLYPNLRLFEEGVEKVQIGSMGFRAVQKSNSRFMHSKWRRGMAAFDSGDESSSSSSSSSSEESSSE